MRSLREHSGEGAERCDPRPRISVIVPAHNAESSLPKLLRAFKEQTVEQSLFELVIVDDCSTDGTLRVVEESGVATAVSSPSRGGSARARNLGLERRIGSIVAFTDADCVPAPDWIESGLSAMAEADLDILVGHVDMPLGQSPTKVALIDGAHNLNQERYARDGHGATANLWIRASLFEGVGLFNPNLISGADTELCLRAVTAGARLEYRPEVLVSHAPRTSARALARKCFRLGFGAAQHRRHAADPTLRHRPRYWLHPGSYLFRRDVKGMHRLERQGYRFNRADLAWLRVVQHFCVRLPYAVGNLAGTLAERLRRTSSEPIPALRRAGQPAPR